MPHREPAPRGTLAQPEGPQNKPSSAEPQRDAATSDHVEQRRARPDPPGGIENYSRHIDGREAGDGAAYTLLEVYFPDDFLIFLDEPYGISVPQIHGMYEGDRSRKETLVAHGFRLPSALWTTGPLRFEEFSEPITRCCTCRRHRVSYETGKSKRIVAADRPSNWASSILRSKSALFRRQVNFDDSIAEIRGRVDKDQPDPRHHADEEDGGRPHRSPAPATGHARALHALRGGHGAAHRGPPRSATG